MKKRMQIAEDLLMFETDMKNNPCSGQREIVEKLGIPRSTLRHWLERKNTIDAAPEVIEFFESPVGTAFLHRLVSGAHFVFSLCNPCGIRPICLYFELTGLNNFVASSYGSQQKVSVAMEEEAGAFASKEVTRLAEGMSVKQITTVKDETFHPETCLVAIEAVSNYILLEKYASGRKADDWKSAMKEATEGLNIEVIQCTSDEGRGIVSHVINDLNAHHSTDLFHVQQDPDKRNVYGLEKQDKRCREGIDGSIGRAVSPPGSRSAFQ
ncbi:hypothetical protein [Desulfobacter postgatei]|uniref:hypothetical protein n=1 Tax=Desulfobacter postgatei TaxID=2293 RepID=UPI00259B20A5|nr:hypothetical protein [uncultured Desulfobacter sp.]